jgi:hypothetical protein
MRRRWRELSFEKQLSIVIMPILLVVLSVGLPMLLDGGGDDPEPPPPTKGSISVPEVVVNNPQRDARQDPETGAFALRKASLPAVELTLHNVGTRRSIVRRARFTIRRHTQLPICITAGELPVGRTYGISLPPDPAPGTVVESAPLRRQLAPDKADVLRFRFSIDEREPSGDHLYEIGISILHDASPRPQPAGTVLLSLPGAPDEGQLWTPDEEAVRQERLDAWGPENVACWERNTQRLLAFLKRPGIRSPELEAIPRTL